jgi:uncharacterized protein
MSTVAQQTTPSPKTGDFVWHELRTTDAKGAQEFYTHVVGWQAKSSGDPGGVPYTLLSVGDLSTAGLMQMTPQMIQGGMKPSWAGFIGVDDVDAYARRIEQAGTVGWNELSANDEQSAWPFYSDMFGWTVETTMDMGPQGKYRIFKNGGAPMGAMMTRDPNNSPVPFWLFYFNVDDIDAAATRIKEKNGQVLMGPHQVPGDQWIILGLDPQGALFSLVGPRKS